MKVFSVGAADTSKTRGNDFPGNEDPVGEYFQRVEDLGLTDHQADAIGGVTE